jgi:hypothetical protein
MIHFAVEASTLCVLSHTGATARSIAKYRPSQPTLCITPSDQTARQLCLSRGVYPRVVGSMIGSEQILTHNVAKLVEEGVVREGEVVICSHGDSHSSPGSTSVIKVSDSDMPRTNGVFVTVCRKRDWALVCVLHEFNFVCLSKMFPNFVSEHEHVHVQHSLY